MALTVSAALLTLGGAAEAAPVSFDGQQVRVSEFLFDPSFVTAEEVVSVGDGVELPNFGAAEGGFFRFGIDIGATSITLVANQTLAQAPGSFGFAFADAASAITRIVGAEIVASEGYTGIDEDTLAIVSGGDGILLNLKNVGVSAGSLLRIDVAFAETPGGVIPLPGTLPLALGGFAVLGVFRRRRLNR